MFHIDSNVLTKSIICFTDCIVCKMARTARNEDPIILLEGSWSYRAFLSYRSVIMIYAETYPVFPWNAIFVE